MLLLLLIRLWYQSWRLWLELCILFLRPSVQYPEECVLLLWQIYKSTITTSNSRISTAISHITAILAKFLFLEIKTHKCKWTSVCGLQFKQFLVRFGFIFWWSSTEQGFVFTDTGVLMYILCKFFFPFIPFVSTKVRSTLVWWEVGWFWVLL